MNDDFRLIDEALAGNAASFGKLVQKYQDRLYNTMLHIVRSPEEAEDVVQDAFVQAFVKLHTFARTSAFYTWLYRIAFNVSVSRQRRKRPTISVDATYDATGVEPAGHEDTPDEILERQESIRQVHHTLERLDDASRSILVLREFDGMSYEQISQVLDLPLGTVRSRLHRARLQLREELSELLGSHPTSHDLT
ncbi:MAG: sigma-70 family RNA polymerase sigma factor [Pirellulaceae bacterium]|nr:sigma-70 family RNA polymerase sigma factor [Pirellulaceae bacterium]